MKSNDQYTLVDLPGLIQSPWKRAFYRIIQFPFESALGLRRLNQGYDRVTNRTTDEFEFIELVKEDVGVSFELPDEKSLEPYRRIEGPIVIVSNHPFGGIESFVLVQLMSRIRSDYQIIANFLLIRIRELKRVLFPVDPYETGSSKRKNVLQMKKLLTYLKSGGMLHIFPAGEVSSYKFKEKKVYDRAWNPNICKIIQKTGATVIPLYFHGRNSMLFQVIGFLSVYIRSVFLAREFVYPHTRFIRYRLGSPIPPDVIFAYDDPVKLAAFLREETYRQGERLTGNADLELSEKK